MNGGLVGPVQSVPGAKLVNASQPGAILVVLQNGKVRSVVEPGKRVGKFFRGPMIGNFQVIEVNTGWVNVKRKITNVRSAKDGAIQYQAVSLTVSVTAQINPGNGYRVLKRLINDAGLGLADALVAALTSGLERELRATFARGSHEFWHSSSLTAEFASMFPVRSAFGPSGYEGLLSVISIDSVEAEWDEHYLTKLTAEKDVAISDSIRAAAVAEEQIANARAATHAAGEAEVAAVQANARLELLQQVQAYAELLGRPPEYFTDPAAYADLMGRRHELAMKLIEPHNQGLLHMHPELLSVFSGHVGQAPLPAGSPQPLQLAAAPGPLSGPPTIDITPELEFSSNARLRRKWRAERPGDDVLGIASAQRRNSAAVVAVVDGPPPGPAELETVEKAFAEYLDAERVTIVCTPAASTLPELVSSLVTAIAPRFAASVTVGADVHRDLDGEQLVITLTSPSGAAAELRDQLTQPEPPLLAAIEELLSFDEARVEAVFA
jgi:hypothetical protein